MPRDCAAAAKNLVVYMGDNNENRLTHEVRMSKLCSP